MSVPLWWYLFCRIYQAVFYVLSYLLRWRGPQLLKGNGALKALPYLISGANLKSCLLVTDEVIVKLGLTDDFVAAMKSQNISVTIFDGVLPNPTIDLVEKAFSQYKVHHCDHLVAIGGGSVMDCAKMVGARWVRPNKTVREMSGLMKVLWYLPPLFAVPTTAGTGSECTLASIVTDRATQEKFAVMDPFLVPSHAVLDASLTTKLPKFVTATTGMDALTHAVEAYANVFHYRQADGRALRAISLISKFLLRAYEKGDDMEAREGMLEASYLAGLAFTRAAVGNVHSVAHALGAMYNVPHGLANAVILPEVLTMYGPCVFPALAKMADAAGLDGSSQEEKAKNFIAWIRRLNKLMNIPSKLGDDDERYRVQPKDVSFMVKHALREANPFYPVPVIFGEEEMTEVFQRITSS